MTAICNVGREHIIVEGDYKPLVWTITNISDGAAYDFTGVTKVFFSIKKDATDLYTAAIVKLNSIDNPGQVEYDAPDPGAGKIRVKLESADILDLAVLGPMVYDIKVLKSGKPQTLIKGAFPALDHAVTEVYA